MPISRSLDEVNRDGRRISSLDRSRARRSGHPQSRSAIYGRAKHTSVRAWHLILERSACDRMRAVELPSSTPLGARRLQFLSPDATERCFQRSRTLVKTSRVSRRPLQWSSPQRRLVPMDSSFHSAGSILGNAPVEGNHANWGFSAGGMGNGIIGGEFDFGWAPNIFEESVDNHTCSRRRET